MIPDALDRMTRQQILTLMNEYLCQGYTDPELLYQGMRFAISLGMADTALRFYVALEPMLMDKTIKQLTK